MLLGSITAKVLNDADCPVATSRHAETIAPRPLGHREWLCTISLDDDSERVLRYAHQAATEAHSNLHIIHAIQATDRNVTVQMDLEQQVSLRKDSRRKSVLLICNDEWDPARRFRLWSAPSRRRCLRLLGDLTRMR